MPSRKRVANKVETATTRPRLLATAKLAVDLVNAAKEERKL